MLIRGGGGLISHNMHSDPWNMVELNSIHVFNFDTFVSQEQCNITTNSVDTTHWYDDGHTKCFSIDRKCHTDINIA